MAKASLRTGLIVVLVKLGLAVCGNAKPFNCRPEADEMKPGAGLFSGEDGKFVIFGRSKTEFDGKKSEEIKSPEK